MEKITTNQIINAIKRNIWLILIPALLVAGLVFARNLMTAGTVEAEAVLIVTSNDEGPMTYNKIILNEKLANIYGQFLQSDDLYQNVIDKTGSSYIKAAEIKNNLDYTVNPQGGTIAFTYRGLNENSTKDILTLITEEFRAFAKSFLNMENIEYLQNVTVKKTSKVRGLIFTIAGFILGALLGILLLIIKEILSDKIHNADDIREMGIEVLADISNKDHMEYAKVKRKIETTSDKAVVGLMPIAENFETSEVIDYLAEELKVPVVDAQKVKAAEEGIMDIKYKLNKYSQDYPYIIVDEKIANDPYSIEISSLEDYKILFVGGRVLHKGTLRRQIEEYERLGIKVLGVIYHK